METNVKNAIVATDNNSSQNLNHNLNMTTSFVQSTKRVHGIIDIRFWIAQLHEELKLTFLTPQQNFLSKFLVWSDMEPFRNTISSTCHTYKP